MRVLLILLAIIMTELIVGQEIEIRDEEKHLHSDQGVVFTGFPLHEEDYATDVQKIRQEAIGLYGPEEWRLNVITSELHGHLGIYAIIGSKMGLYAREVLGAGHDELMIQSFAGSKPPVSCMNDGLQVSTGATLGHGLISIRENEIPFPAASFTYQDKTITISLNKELHEEIDGLLREALLVNGGLTNGYWKKVREHALLYWLKLDRKSIFKTNY